MKTYNEILEPNRITLPSFTINDEEWVSKSTLIKRFMKVNRQSKSHAYRGFEKQCEHWETIKEGRRVFVNAKHRYERYTDNKLPAAKRLSNTLETIKTETDLDRFRIICSILAKDHPLVFTQCVDAAKKVHINKKMLNKIDRLQAELDKLKEELI